MKRIDNYAPVAILLNMCSMCYSAFADMYNDHLTRVRYGGDDTH